MLWDKNKLFCEINPTCYAISEQKEICKRHLKNLLSRERFAKPVPTPPLPNLVSDHRSALIKTGKDIDPALQQNKAVNIRLACAHINGMIIHPGEVFSFWGTIGKITPRKGYKDGRVIVGNKLTAGLGGGLCNLSNTIHWLILHSPLEVVEFHSHSDALAPDHGERVPFSSGTSVNYNYLDYRFKNSTDQDVQLLLWCEGETLCAELRSERAFPCRFELVEEDHHFHKEGEKYYRVSKIYQIATEKATGKRVSKTLVLDNHSEVMFNYGLIPQDQIH